MTLLLGIDPGPTESAYVIIDTDDGLRPIDHDKLGNETLLHKLGHDGWMRFHTATIETISSYGMPVGADVFTTCVWVGRYYQQLTTRVLEPPRLIPRHPVKLHHCHSSRATDAHIRQALVDRFTPGQRNNGKGTKTEPGWFHGFHSDIWAAYALAVYAADTAGTS